MKKNNKNQFIWQTLVILVLTLSSCEEYPVYEFIDTGLPSSSFEIKSQGLQVEFINNSAHSTTYLWEFGDGETSSEASPVHTYASKSVYTITLVSADNNEAQASYSLELPVGYPMASFGYDVDRKTATFTNNSDNATSYEWDFGDGNTSSEENPVHVYDAKGTYTVKLTASDGTDSNVYEESIFVPGKFIPEFIAPSFEISSYRSDWDWNGASSSGSPAPPDGSRGAKLQTDDWIAQTLQVDPNENYTVKFWYVSKSSTLPAPVGARVEIIDAADGTTVLHTHETGLSPTSSAYVESTLTFDSANASSIIVKISWVDVEFRVDLFSIE